MFTRCPDCLAVHALNASLIVRAGGRVRCGRCSSEYSVLDSLFDHWPDSTALPPAANGPTTPPVLGQPDGEATREFGPAIGEDIVSGKRGRAAWIVMLAAVSVITLINLAWTFREPLSKDPEVRKFLDSIGVHEPLVTAERNDASVFHLVSRDMHQHPTRAGMLALSIMFVNRSPVEKPYPAIVVTLTDAAGLAMARREFEPVEYLPAGTAQEPILAPNVHIPVLLEFTDPGDNVVGFEIAFR